MESAEALYRADTSSDKSPPLWLDVSFVLIISMIHIIYSIKFSKFSLTYLKAKCAEKLSKRQWNESKLYLHAFLSQKIENYIDLKTNDAETDKLVYTELWDQIIILRYILRIIIFLCCWVVLTVYITVQLNLCFEYFLLCLLKPQNGSFLGLFMLPFFFFVHIAIIRYIIYGIIVSWTINVDSVADRISYQQNQREIKHFAESSTSVISTTQTRSFKDKISAFNSPYFMAVHWRLFIVSLSILASIIGFPFLSIENEFEVKDVFFIQLFIRYIFISMSCWLFIYCIISMTSSLCARISTLFMFDATLNSDDKQTESIKRKNSFLRLFCLMDAFGIKDENIIWKKYKIITYSIFFVGGILLIIIGSIISNGLVWFIGVIDICYYAINILLTTKPRGIYYLWTADMLALELDHDETVDPLPDHRHIVLQQNMSRHSGVIASGFKSQLTEVTINDFEQDEEPVTNLETIWQEEMAEMKSQEAMRTIDETESPVQSFPPSLGPSLAPSLNPSLDNDIIIKHETNDHEIQTNVLKLFIKIYETTYHDRRMLDQQNASKTKIFLNYFHLTFTLYTQYWLLILPYNYKIRPLSLFCSGQSISEHIIKYEYKKKTCKEMMKEILIKIWRILLRPMSAIFIFLLIIFGLYISAKIHFGFKESNQILDETYNNNSIVNATDLYSFQQYPICDSLHWNGNLSTLDLLILTHMIYGVHNLSDATQLTCLYFNNIFTDTMNQSKCIWEVIYVSYKLPLFMHLRHHENKTDIIVLRGTLVFLEYMQDLALFNQVVQLQLASWIVPVTTILPTQFIIQTVYLSSLIEGVVDDIVRARYDIPVYKYAFNLLQNANYEIDSLYFAGHSMGGSIGMAVAAQLFGIYKQENRKYFSNNKELEIKSFIVNAPGMLYNSRKFSLDAYDVYSTATVVKTNYDILSEIDVTIGFVQNVKCDEKGTYLLDCHRIGAIIYELGTKCNVYHSNNPTIIKAFTHHLENADEDTFDYALANTET